MSNAIVAHLNFYSPPVDGSCPVQDNYQKLRSPKVADHGQRHSRLEDHLIDSKSPPST